MRAVLKSYRKNILREMKDNLSRMVSLFGIVALGVMMLTGLCRCRRLSGESCAEKLS